MELFATAWHACRHTYISVVSYFEDLSDYTYHRSVFARPETKAIGWLALGHDFSTCVPTDDILDLLWSHCSISIAQMRGLHFCEFCPSGSAINAERHGKKLLLGSSEIRVFSGTGRIYAAPTLIYHYVAVHHYCPPDEFLRALREGPAPPSRGYFERLERLNLAWNETYPGGEIVIPPPPE